MGIKFNLRIANNIIGQVVINFLPIKQGRMRRYSENARQVMVASGGFEPYNGVGCFLIAILLKERENIPFYTAGRTFQEKGIGNVEMAVNGC